MFTCVLPPSYPWLLIILQTFMCKVLSFLLTIFFPFFPYGFSFFLFYVYSCLPGCIFACSVHEGQKRALAPLGLESQMVVSCQTGAGNPTLEECSSPLNPFPSPLSVYLQRFTPEISLVRRVQLSMKIKPCFPLI